MFFGGRLPLGNISNLKPSCAVVQCVLSFFFIWAVPGNEIPAFSDLPIVYKISEQDGNSAMES